MLRQLAEEFLAAFPDYLLVGNAEGGLSSGAVIMRDGHGDEWIFKGLHNSIDMSVAQVRLSEMLRKRDLPLAEHAEPLELPSGIGQLQRRVAGDIRMDLTMPMAQQMVRMNKLLSNVDAINGFGNFGELLIETTTEGNADYCSHAPLITYSDESRRILQWVKAVGTELTSVKVPQTDAVHYDFHHLNVLWHNDEPAVVIDWDGSRLGDHTFDLVTLALDANQLTSDDVLDYLKTEITSRASRELIRLYVAHMALRVCAWNIAKQPAEKAARRVPHAMYWVNWADSL